MFDIRKYFGHRSNKGFYTDADTDVDVAITREAPLGLRPGQPRTTSFNRNLIIGLSGFFVFIFLFSMFYGMSKPVPDKKNGEEVSKDKKISTVAQSASQLDKLPSSYGGKMPNSGVANGTNSLSQPPIQDSSTLPRQSSQSINYSPPRQSSYQAMDYSSPPIPVRSQVVSQQRYDSPMVVPAGGAAVVPAVNSTINKEEQELAEARKSPIRFNLK